jgi:hypothetical protein
MYSLNRFLRKPSGHEKFISYYFVVVSGIGCKPFGITPGRKIYGHPESLVINSLAGIKFIFNWAIWFG